MNIYYRGYVIHEDIRSICYTVYGRRPRRVELATCGTAREALQWVDHQVNPRKVLESAFSAPSLL